MNAKGTGGRVVLELCRNARLGLILERKPDRDCLELFLSTHGQNAYVMDDWHYGSIGQYADKD